MTRYRRANAVDQLDYEEGSALLFEHRLVVLSPLGAAAYGLLAEETTITDLTQALIERFGVPAGGAPESVVADLLTSMVNEGVLVRDVE